ncbi:hypothetical protein JCM6882_006540 [Rhodosporidiobolus microsporus]
MAPKRKRDSVIDLANTSEEDSDDADWTSSAASRAKGNKSSQSGGSGSVNPHKTQDPGALSASQRMSQVSSFFTPRSSLFGGAGTSIEHGRIKPTDSPQKGKGKAKALKPTPIADQLLTFAPAVSPEKLLKQLPYGEAQLLYTTPPKTRGRQKGKTKGKGKKVVKGKRKADSDNSDEPDEDADSSDGERAPGEPVSWDNIVGADPDMEVQRALVVSPTMQLPWIPSKFATPKQTKTREIKLNIPMAKYEELEKKRKKKASSEPTFTRLYANKIPLSLLHHEKLEECVNLDKWTQVKTHQVDVDLAGEKKGSLGAKFALLTRRDKPNHLYLRFAVYSADNDARQWVSTENALWIKDFPMLISAAASPSHNPTHTPFSLALYNFLHASPFALASSAVGKRLLDDFRLFDFSSSSDFQLVTSSVGTWVGEEGFEQGGGFDSLARAMKALKPREGGKWKVEYLTPIGVLPSPSKFLPRLYSACMGVSPLEYLTDSPSDAAKAARKSYEAGKANAHKVVVLYPTESAVSQTKEGKGEAKYHLKWEGPDYEAAGKETKGVLRDYTLKSERVNHSNMILILHQPLEKDKDAEDDGQYEAFLYVGSHAPTPASWGALTPPSPSSPPSITLTSYDLGVLYRCATSSTWTGLLEQVKEIILYERPLEEYGRRDAPQPTEVRPPPEEGKQKKVGRPRKKKKGEEVNSD